MWKRIGVKNDDSPEQMHTSLTNSPQRESRYHRKRPLDEKSLVERDLSSSRLSASSRDLNKMTSESSMVIESVRNVQTLHSSEDELLVPMRFTINGRKEGVWQPGKEEKLAESKLVEKSETGSSKGKKSPTRQNVTFAEIAGGETDRTRNNSIKANSEKDVGKLPKNIRQASSGNSPNAASEYIESMQHKLRESRKANIKYEVKVAEIKKIYNEMRKVIKDELGTITGYSKDFIVYAAKEITNQVDKHRKTEKALLKQAQNVRVELEQKLKVETQKSENLKAELYETKKKLEETLVKLNRANAGNGALRQSKDKLTLGGIPLVTEKITAESNSNNGDKKLPVKPGEKEATAKTQSNVTPNGKPQTVNQRQPTSRITTPVAKLNAKNQRDSSKQPIKAQEATQLITPQRVRTHIRRTSGQKPPSQPRIQAKQVIEPKILSKNANQSKQSQSPPLGARQKGAHIAPVIADKVKPVNETAVSGANNVTKNIDKPSLGSRSGDKHSPSGSAPPSNSPVCGNKQIAVDSQMSNPQTPPEAHSPGASTHRSQPPAAYEASIQTIMNAISKMRTSISDMSTCKQTLQQKINAPERKRRVISRKPDD